MTLTKHLVRLKEKIYSGVTSLYVSVIDNCIKAIYWAGKLGIHVMRHKCHVRWLRFHFTNESYFAKVGY